MAPAFAATSAPAPSRHSRRCRAAAADAAFARLNPSRPQQREERTARPLGPMCGAFRPAPRGGGAKQKPQVAARTRTMGGYVWKASPEAPQYPGQRPISTPPQRPERPERTLDPRPPAGREGSDANLASPAPVIVEVKPWISAATVFSAYPSRLRRRPRSSSDFVGQHPMLPVSTAYVYSAGAVPGNTCGRPGSAPATGTVKRSHSTAAAPGDATGARAVRGGGGDLGTAPTLLSASTAAAAPAAVSAPASAAAERRRLRPSSAPIGGRRL
eukprot:TRINITY_DN55935_c0_g1_i1.p1 TRINITY_DN55935_c0_g1~~TRINITY_DN55935_c0_g1_i1.p1  ORF type:complete len:271 (-),score=49.37 TRINITY_DN55935_c0_g1_i1:417-1229(-)